MATIHPERVDEPFDDTNMPSSDCMSSDDNDPGTSDPEKQLREKGSNLSSSSDTLSSPIKLDAKGLPLVPQPSRFKDDPLVSFYDPALHIAGRTLLT